ncbi:MAG: peroxiredoxin family protein [Betaproteobacteria bacterium]|nr:peroxiredoxin family protein [Betaproteobacteria bacterium]
MAGFEFWKAQHAAAGVKVFAASVDPIDKAKEVAAGVSFPIGYGVTREQADQLGSWWEDRRGIVQPSEFILGADGKIMLSSYSSGPLARIEPMDVVRMVNFYEAQQKK